jgi:hypothetical protein
VDDDDLLVKHQSLGRREHYFSPLQGLQTGLKLDVGDLYQLNGDEQGDQNNEAADFQKKVDGERR